MELELGLALVTTRDPMKGFDLNKCWIEPNDMGCAEGWRQGDPVQMRNCGYSKRYKYEEEGPEISLGGNRQKMLPLVSWNEEPNEEDHGGLRGNSSSQLVTPIKNLEDEDRYVKGWPPIQSWRKKFLSSYHNGNQLRAYRGSNSMYIKVKMEGVAIGRKINLRCFDSYGALFSTLIAMFARYIENNESANMSDYYTLKFQDRHGNWLQATDAPWKFLVNCVKRIEIQRNVGE